MTVQEGHVESLDSGAFIINSLNFLATNMNREVVTMDQGSYLYSETNQKQDCEQVTDLFPCWFEKN